MNYFRKKHKYETQADLQQLTPEQIVRLPVTDVGNYIKDETGGVPLTGNKRSAMNRLLAIKRNPPPTEKAYEDAIHRFLTENDKVDKLLVDTTMGMTTNTLDSHKLNNRLNTLNNQPHIPETFEQEIARRLRALGGKTKRKRRVKTRKLGRKTNKSRNKKFL